MTAVSASLVILNVNSWLRMLLAYLPFAAYICMAAVIYLMRGRQDRSSWWLVWGLAAFSIPFGLEQAMEAWTLWGVGSGFANAMKAVTAVGSISTAILLMTLVARTLTLSNRDASAPEAAGPTPGLRAGRQQLWLGLAIAVVTTLLTLFLLESAGPDMAVNGPIIVFLFPIILSAYVGGVIPGLVATLGSTLLSIYYVLPPSHSWHVTSALDNIKWITLSAAGTLISIFLADKESMRMELAPPRSPVTLLSTERRVRVGFAVLLACLVAIGAVSYSAIERLRSDSYWVDHTQQVISSLRQLLSSVTDAETGERGYIIAGTESFLEPYHAAMQNIGTELSNLRRLTADNPQQQKLLNALDPLVAERVAELRDGIEMRHKGFAPAQGLVLAGRGRNVHDRIRKVVAEMEANEQALLIKRQTLTQHAETIAKITIVGGSALAVAVVVAALWFVGLAIAANRAAEATLRESEAQLDAKVRQRTVELTATATELSRSQADLLDAQRIAQLGHWSWDKTTGRATWSDEIFHIFGLDPGEPAPTLEKIARVFTPESWARAAEAQTQTLQHGSPFKIDLEFVRSDGRKGWITARGEPVRDSSGQIVGRRGTVQDITERKRAEEAVRESEQRFRALVTATSDVVYRMSADWSEMGQLQGRGFIPDAAAPTHNWLQEYIPASDQAQVLAAINEAIRSKSKFELEHRVLRVDGSLGWTFSRAIPRFNERGDIIEWFGAAADVTERKQAEEKLLESEHRLAAIFGSAMDAVISADEGGIITLFNPAAEKVFGCRSADAIGQPMERLIPSRFRTAHAEHIREFANSTVNLKHMTERGEISGLRLDGTEFPIEASISRARLGQEKIFTVILRDITERKRVEEAVAFLASVVESSQDAIIGKSPEGRIQSWNRGAQKLYGYTAAEVIGQSITMLSPPDRQEEIGSWLAQLRQGGTVEHQEAVRLHKDGRRLDVSISISSVKDAQGRMIGASTIARDITERKRAEAALRESEERYRSLFESMDQGFCVIEMIFDQNGKATDWRYLDVNPAFGRQSGLIEAKGKTIRELVPRIEAYWFEKYGRVVDTGAGIRFTEYSEALSRWFDLYAFRVGEPEQRRVAVLFNNITDYKRAQKALAQKNEDLARSNADLEQFAYVASHDLKEPLRAVSGCVQLLVRRWNGKLDDRSAEYLTHVVDGTKRMESLIDGLLAYSRVGTRGAKFQPVELAAVLETALQNLAVAIQETGAAVSHDSLPTVDADATQLVSLFQNLIANALKFRGAAPPLIHIGAERSGASWHFSIRDNGIGIDPQYFGRIFGIFQRLHTRAEYPGTGIGLAVCKKIVERHGGRIWVESALGSGSTFYFSLAGKGVRNPLGREAHA